MKRKILTILTLTMSFYIIFSFIIGMLSGIFKSKNPSQKDYLVQLENKSLDDLQDKIDTYQNNILNENNDSSENENINYAKYYENTIFMGDSITEALSEFGILDSYNVIANKGDTVIKASQNIDKLQGINPKNLVLLYGMNDVIAFDSNSSEESSNAFKEKYIELINSENLNEFRLKVTEVATATGSTYIDLASIITDKDSLHEQDGIHYKYDLYRIWLDLLKNYIQ
ncbi:hypothetical protein [Paraclostridium bifermentans]|jgi:hypothetical protein|uniref:hypothetical protein n=1 Tax=Paraclostridium bifermentans TaxID=1490 RepID=UPI0018A02563|nr:hypothetical protein [Paraclostridium bifermentans]